VNDKIEEEDWIIRGEIEKHIQSKNKKKINQVNLGQFTNPWPWSWDQDNLIQSK
jgi:hypothetical protein